MKQNELNRAVARATGESVKYVRTMGFSLVVIPEGDDQEAPGDVSLPYVPQVSAGSSPMRDQAA